MHHNISYLKISPQTVTTPNQTTLTKHLLHANPTLITALLSMTLLIIRTYNLRHSPTTSQTSNLYN